MIEDALKLSVYFGESVSVGPAQASDALMACLADHDLVAAALLRGIEGFGVNRRIHAHRFPDVSTDLPLLACAVDRHERILAVLDDVDRAVPRGLVTLEHARLVTGQDVADAEFPAGPGLAAQLTIYCSSAERAGGRPAYREAAALLQQHGATGAIVLPGVDGLMHGARQRARLFSANSGTPMIIVSVGAPDLLRRSLPHLAEILADPVLALEAIAQVKHDGELLEPPPSVAEPGVHGQDVWQTIQVYTRRSAEVDGRAVYSELTRRLREIGAAGATTILGDWGFSGDERPYGDKLGRVASHRPTYTVYIDRPQNVAEAWPMIDELTAEHGIVTSVLVPGYRERAGDIVHGSLDVPERLVNPRQLAGERDARAESPWSAAAAAEQAPWLRALLERIHDFVRSRGGHEPVVRITLADGERFFLYALEAGPGDQFLTLYPHPERYDEMLQGAGGRLPPRALVVPHQSIAKIELLAKPPRGARSLVTLRPPR